MITCVSERGRHSRFVVCIFPACASIRCAAGEGCVRHRFSCGFWVLQVRVVGKLSRRLREGRWCRYSSVLVATSLDVQVDGLFEVELRGF